ncbi:hypothetical protein K2173_001276 [Erythroxylum novogranatense]|uniref:DUF4283 domain-containing protein n=1 Tax=Erythroxylum novogranatense TaxID=1862640 RepID=A0AAV8T4N5_9ROSI|nr:hypothetical protein K2173_001276 [Erythroxylum novogranatense]
MAAVWRPIKGTLMTNVGNNAFLLQFLHWMDMEWIMDGVPWNLMQNLIILAKVPLGTNPKHVPLVKAVFWVQLHDYLIGSRSERAFQEVGNYIDTFMESDHRNFTLVWKEYMRIKPSELRLAEAPILAGNGCQRRKTFALVVNQLTQSTDSRRPRGPGLNPLLSTMWSCTPLELGIPHC